MAKVKVGVAGLGIMGKIHSQIYNEYEKSELILICDSDKKRAKTSAQEFNSEYTTNIQRIKV